MPCSWVAESNLSQQISDYRLNFETQAISDNYDSNYHKFTFR